MHFNTKDITGQKFGRLTAVAYVGKSRWSCICECGNSSIVFSNNLTKGNSTSCGCRAREVTAKRNTTHDKSDHPLYGIWLRMRRRCNNPKHDKYIWYGGRGIRVCDAWNASFQAFLDDMEPTWSKGLEIDRINNDGPYSPDNCKWSTRMEQMQNLSTNHWIDAPDGRMTLSAAARHYGILPDTLWMRLKRGWSIERALLTPVYKKRSS